MNLTKPEKEVEVLLRLIKNTKVKKEEAEKYLKELVDKTIEKSKPLWEIEVKNVVEEFNKRPNFVHSKRIKGHTTPEERDAITHFAWNGIPAMSIAQKFAVSLPTVYHYSYSEPSYWNDEVECVEYRVKHRVAKDLFKQQ